jgi:hypothetical protein
MAVESRLLARALYRAAFGVARRLVVTGRPAPEPRPESDPVQALGPSAAPAAPGPASDEPGRTNREVADDD